MKNIAYIITVTICLFLFVVKPPKFLLYGILSFCMYFSVLDILKILNIKHGKEIKNTELTTQNENIKLKLNEEIKCLKK
jgi:flagellar biosynthesis component FlhA